MTAIESLANDIDTVVDQVGDWSGLRGARLFVTGGTGFLGRWMLEVLARAEARHALGVRAVVMSRDPARFAATAPHLAANPMFDFIAGDVLAPFEAEGAFSHVIHAATDASADLNLNNPRKMFDTVVDGTRRALDFAVEKRPERFLYFSSGAVYGAQPWEETHIGEDWRGAPDCTEAKNAYGEGKRAGEMLCAIAGKQGRLDQGGLNVVTARIYAVLGPLLSLDIHFASGNFIRDVLAGRTIRIIGSGTAVRSLLYVGDLTAWLFRSLLHAPRGAVYNMGSEESVTIVQMAQRIAAVLGGSDVEILGQPDPGWNPGRYVPSTKRIRNELGVEATVGLDECIRRTAAWNGWRG